MLTSMGLQRAETKRQQLQFDTKLQDLEIEREAERRTSEAQIRQLMTQLSSPASAAPRSTGLFGYFGQ
jgi:multidrug efflux pump subunit AcrA (membrane-fusion protein)